MFTGYFDVSVNNQKNLRVKFIILIEYKAFSDLRFLFKSENDRVSSIFS